MNDGLGSPVARTNEQGELISRTRYEPYGATAGGATPGIGFTGHVNDPETGLTYMQQRYYDPLAGRFLSVDPVLTDANTGASFNRYGYANNSPYRYIDPDGRDPRDDQLANDANKRREQICGGGAYCSTGPLPSNSSGPGPGSFAAGAAAGAGIGLTISGVCDGVTLGACVLANPLIIGGSALAGGLLNYIAMASVSGSSGSSEDASSSSGSDDVKNKVPKDGGDLKKLSPGEIKKLKDAGYDAHELKSSSSKFDLYKDKSGNVYQLLKGGRGEPSSVDFNIKNIKGQ